MARTANRSNGLRLTRRSRAPVGLAMGLTRLSVRYDDQSWRRASIGSSRAAFHAG
jgi:hypothetical protein